MKWNKTIYINLNDIFEELTNTPCEFEIARSKNIFFFELYFSIKIFMMKMRRDFFMVSSNTNSIFLCQSELLLW